MLIWSEALKRENREWEFDAHAIKRLLFSSMGSSAGENFRWERLVESIRLQCGLPFPHDRRKVVGTARTWCNSIEYVGEFTINENWNAIRLKLTPIKKLPNQLPDPTSPSVTPPAGAGGAPSVAADH